MHSKDAGLEEQSDLGLHCLPKPVCPKTWEHYSILGFIAHSFVFIL